ncbi:MAG TPA: AsmA family protein [Candidatus Limnocylindrales bacterium]|nr:AsmA family protein [Candidatus Limnocylindrales bacterium]
MKRKLLIGIGVVIVVIILIALILPHFIDANQYKPMLESQMKDALGGRNVSIGNISISLLPAAAAEIDSLSIADDPAFSKSPFLKAKELKVGVNLMPLIFSKKLEVRSFTIVEPEVALLRNSAGVWNFSTLSGGSSGSPAKAKPKAAADPPGDTNTNLTVGELTISNGKLTVGTVGSRAKPQTYDNVNVEATDISYTSAFPFKFKAKAPGGGSIAMDGKIGPINSSDASLSPLDAKVEVSQLDLAGTGFVNPSSGLGGIMDYNGTVSSDGRQAKSKGTVKINKLKAAPNGTPATVPVNVDYATNYDLKKQDGNLTQGDVHIGKALAHLTGAYNMAGETTSVQMKLVGDGMPVPDLEGALPAVGVTVPSGSKLEGGTLNLNLAINGPVDKLVITGPVNMSNAKLAGFSMGSKLGALSSFTGLGGGGGGGGSDTVIQTLSTNLRVDPGGTHAQNLNLVIASIGTVTGDGNVSADGKLDCKMVAKLSGGAGGALSQTTSMIPGLGGGGKGGSSGGIPFRIEGTTSNPIFVPDVAGMAKGMAQGEAAGAVENVLGGKSSGGAAGALGGLLGGKKKPQ